MNKLTRTGVGAISCLALTGFLCVVPSVAKRAVPAAVQQSATEAHTVTGKVTAIGKSSFTLAISSADMTNESSPERANARTMTFQVDGNTTIDGAIQVGVQAEVTYRIDSGQYVAINVRVAQ